MKKKKDTPLVKQYNEIKAKNPDTILLFRLGDFFETFNDDAIVTARVCGITLTKRNNGAAGDMPLAGFPHHQLDVYLPKLVRAGHRVAVCEQLEDPKQAKGIVKRGVVEVVTPGVALYDKLLDSKVNNYISALSLKRTKDGIPRVGLAYSDISTGEFFVSEFSVNQLNEIMETIAPAEVIISKDDQKDLLADLNVLSFEPSVTKLEPWVVDEEFGREALLGHFKTKSLKGFGIENFACGLAAAGAILHYVKETQQGQLEQITGLSIFDPSEFMPLDFATRRNLEITYSMSGDGKEGSLISILDKTCTPMGGRLFKRWVTMPLRNLEKIQFRLHAVCDLFDSGDKRLVLREFLQAIGDLERLISKICNARANPKDVVSLRRSLEIIPQIKEILESMGNSSLDMIAEKMHVLSDLIDLISKALVEEPTVNLGSGNVFCEGYSDELDEYVDAKYSGKNWINEYQLKERERTGISSLKIGFNNVFGYYIDVTKVHKDKVPEDYDRKQTLTNSERYITPELKQFEEKILSAEEKISDIENALFSELRIKIALHTEAIQSDAYSVAMIDCLQSFAEASREYDYTKPEIDESTLIDIEDGRHPVVENLLPIGQNFVPNSTKVGDPGNIIHILTGPNMSGKSCYLRQTALVVLLGQIGCFVPARKARFGMVDRIFTRVGAQDNITQGESTFLVEMHEAANIMNNATDRSLILLDEVGRGTATFDGISIAWAIAEYIHNEIGAKTLFATHYHELNEMEEKYENIINYKVDVIEAGDTIIFSHKVMPGASSHSFGIHVAQMAGLPKELTDRADIILRAFSESSSDVKGEVKSKKTSAKKIKAKVTSRITDQMSIFEFRDDAIREQIAKLDINTLTPLDSLKILSEMHKQVIKENKKR
jgi:DNA mismatch repair protein MutS